jgi:predicted NUDIX family phosphoesterase
MGAPSKPPEKVLVVPREELFEGMSEPQGFGTERLDALLGRIRGLARFEPRPEVENDPSLKQVIPYVLVVRGPEIFLLKRRAGQTEARLRNLHSVGVGGHINPPDGEAGDPVEAGLRRELAEEVEFRGRCEIEPLGYLNDDSNSVGSVHFGLVFVARTGGEVVVAERDLMEGRFLPFAEALALLPGMETWSRILVEAVRDRPELEERVFGKPRPDRAAARSGGP